MGGQVVHARLSFQMLIFEPEVQRVRWAERAVRELEEGIWSRIVCLTQAGVAVVIQAAIGKLFAKQESPHVLERPEKQRVNAHERRPTGRARREELDELTVGIAFASAK